MNPTAAFSFELSPDAAQTEIDTYLRESYQRDQLPNRLSGQDSLFFHQSTSNLLGFTWDEDANVGGFDEIDELETIPDTDTRIGNTTNVKMQKWVKQVPVSMEAFKADLHGKRADIGRQMGDRARLTVDKRAILNTYGSAFVTTVNTTPDGQAWASNSHVALKYSLTVDNLETGSLNADNLWTVVQALANQYAQDSELGGYDFEGLVVPLILFKTAKETLDSELVPFSGENQVNIYDTVYGQVRLAMSPFLGSRYNSNSNANTSYHVLSSQHQAQRKVFMGLTSSLIPPENTANDAYIYRARFIERHFPMSWNGSIHSNGTA
jgi:hypothetical protein